MLSHEPRMMNKNGDFLFHRLYILESFVTRIIYSFVQYPWIILLAKVGFASFWLLGP